MEKSIKLITISIFILIGITATPILADDLSHVSNNTKASLPKEVKPEFENPPKLKINRFNIVPKSLQSGQTAELFWNVSGATQVFIDNKSDLKRVEVSPSGRIAVTPLETTNYTLIAYDRSMLAVSTVATIDVHGQPPAPQVTLKADPTDILAGDNVTLTWKTLFANTVIIDNGIGKVNANGTIMVAPKTTTTYTLAATGSGGSIIANITIKVLNSQATNRSPTN